MKEKYIILSEAARVALNTFEHTGYSDHCEMVPPSETIRSGVYAEVKKALLTLGGTWSEAYGSFKMPKYATEAIVEARRTGKVLDLRLAKRTEHNPVKAPAKLKSPGHYIKLIRQDIAKMIKECDELEAMFK